jgi:hypothetical protein
MTLEISPTIEIKVKLQSIIIRLLSMDKKSKNLPLRRYRHKNFGLAPPAKRTNILTQCTALVYIHVGPTVGLHDVCSREEQEA